MSLTRLALSHVFAAAVVVVGSGLLVAGVYAGLLGWAILFNQPLGGPLALPFMVLAALATSGLSVICVLMPAALVGEWFLRQSRRGLPVAALMVTIEAASIAAVATLVWDVPARSATVAAIAGAGVLLALLGVYWSCARSASWLLGRTRIT